LLHESFYSDLNHHVFDLHSDSNITTTTATAMGQW